MSASRLPAGVAAPRISAPRLPVWARMVLVWALAAVSSQHRIRAGRGVFSRVLAGGPDQRMQPERYDALWAPHEHLAGRGDPGSHRRTGEVLAARGTRLAGSLGSGQAVSGDQGQCRAQCSRSRRSRSRRTAVFRHGSARRG
jgi:hypothetical protein